MGILRNILGGLLQFFPEKTNLHVVGLSALCWAVQKLRNNEGT
jgi:hypothetical protein